MSNINMPEQINQEDYTITHDQIDAWQEQIEKFTSKEGGYVYNDIPEFLYIWEKQHKELFSRLGKDCSKTFKFDKLDIEITCQPIAFIYLGHYGPDNDTSCFAQSGHGTLNKWVFGGCKNTAVAIIRNKEHVLCRLLLVFDFVINWVLITNFYYDTIDITCREVCECLKYACQNLTGDQYIGTNKVLIGRSRSTFYFDPDPVLLWSKKNIKHGPVAFYMDENLATGCAAILPK